MAVPAKSAQVPQAYRSFFQPDMKGGGVSVGKARQAKAGRSRVTCPDRTAGFVLALPGFVLALPKLACGSARRNSRK